MAQKVFVSYSHDSPAHRGWVLMLSKELLKRGVDIILDRWDLRAGQFVPAFMAQSIEQADRVLVVCTQRYVSKANAGLGGAGYEGMIIDAQIASDINSIKFIPIARESHVLPRFLQGRLWIDFTQDAEFENSLTELVHEIYGIPRDPKPAIGASPFLDKAEPEVFEPAGDIPAERADRWQDDENLFRDARRSLESRRIETFSLEPATRSVLGLHEFQGEGDARQRLRLLYLDQVLSVLSGNVGRREAIEIWLAGIDQHNKSLSYERIPAQERLLHVQEIRLLYGHLAAQASGIDDFEIRNQIERWLDITRHNMESMVNKAV